MKPMRVVAVVATLMVCISFASCALFAVDLGSQHMKIAMLKQGRDIDVVLNEASKRKSPTLLHVAEDGERIYADAAVSKLATRPKLTYAFTSRLLGHGLDSPMVEFVKQLNFPYVFSEDEERHTLLVDYTDGKKFYIEELVGMLLTYARDLASFAAEQKVKDVVIAVPPFYTQAERQSVLDAAALAGLKVLSLVNDNTAVAVEYGIQKKDREAGSYKVLLVDVGASKTTASVVQYTLKEKTVGGKNKTTSSFDILGEAWDTHLGGMSLDICLTNHFATEFDKKLSGESVFNIPRAFAKLRSEAEKAKMVLSANKEAVAHVEGLHDDIDFKLKVTREEFEEKCQGVFDRIPPVLEEALKNANVTADELSAVELFGGSTRVPRVKDLIQSTVNKELSHSLNTDEAAVMGATFFAANVSAEFRVRNYQMADWNPYAVGVQLVETQEGVVADEAQEKKLSGTLFGRSKPFPSTKVVTVKRFEDFAFDIFYSDKDMLPEGSKDTSIARLHVTGMDAVKKSNLTEGTKPKIQVTFKQNYDGVISISKAEVSFSEDYQFKDKVCKTVNITDDEATAAAANSTAEATSEEEEKNDSSEEEKSAEDADAQVDQDGGAANSTDATNSTSAAEAKKPKTKRECEYVQKTKSRTKKINLELERVHTGFVKGLDKESTKTLRTRLDEMDKNDIRRRERANASNKLESQVYEWRDKLEDPAIAEFSTAEEREKLSGILTDNENYLFDYPDATTEDYLEKIKLVTDITDAIIVRVRESEERADHVEEFKATLVKLREVIPVWEANKTQITEDERNVYGQMIDEMEKWIDGKMEEQSKKEKHEDPAFLVSDLPKKLKPLFQEKKRLDRKPKPKPPKVDKAANATANANSTEEVNVEPEGDNTAGEGESEGTAGEEEAGSGSEGGESENADADAEARSEGHGDEL